MLRQIQAGYGSTITILAGSGINDKNAIELMNYTGISQVHSSCRGWVEDSTTSNGIVDFSYAGESEKNQYEAVDGKKILALTNTLKKR